MGEHLSAPLRVHRHAPDFGIACLPAVISRLHLRLGFVRFVVTYPGKVDVGVSVVAVRAALDRTEDELATSGLNWMQPSPRRSMKSPSHSPISVIRRLPIIGCAGVVMPVTRTASAGG